MKRVLLPNEDIPDYVRNKPASEALRDRIANYWLDRGYHFNVWVEEFSWPDGSGRRRVGYAIRSNVMENSRADHKKS